uniref:Uncharacterized protein n=1 Tax=Parastrongyloides trichosuri TaxID=131310 RepID=A0A0N4Z840_PARTI
MKTKLEKLLTFLIIFFLLKKQTEGWKKCYTGELGIDVKLSFLCNDKPVDVTQVTAKICQQPFIFYICYSWGSAVKEYSERHLYAFKNFANVKTWISYEVELSIAHNCTKRVINGKVINTLDMLRIKVPNGAFSCNKTHVHSSRWEVHLDSSKTGKRNVLKYNI